MQPGGERAERAAAVLALCGCRSSEPSLQGPRAVPGRAQPCPSTCSPKQRGPCARRGWHVPLVLPAAPMRSCDNRGHQRPLLARLCPARTRGAAPGAGGAVGEAACEPKAARASRPGHGGSPAGPGMLLGALGKHGGAGDGGAGRAHTQEGTVSIPESSLCASCLAGPGPVICTPTEVSEMWNLRLICSEMVQVRGWARVSPALRRSSGSLAAA